MTSSYFLSGFFVAIMLGRLFGSLVVDRLGYLRVIVWALISGTLCLVAGILGPSWLLFALPLSGLFFSIVFPTVTAEVSRQHQDHVGTILGVLFTFGGMGGAIGPWVIGLVSQQFGLRIGMCTSIVFGVVALVAIAVLMKRLKSAPAAA